MRSKAIRYCLTRMQAGKWAFQSHKSPGVTRGSCGNPLRGAIVETRLTTGQSSTTIPTPVKSPAPVGNQRSRINAARAWQYSTRRRCQVQTGEGTPGCDWLRSNSHHRATVLNCIAVGMDSSVPSPIEYHLSPSVISSLVV